MPGQLDNHAAGDHVPDPKVQYHPCRLVCMTIKYFVNLVKLPDDVNDTGDRALPDPHGGVVQRGSQPLRRGIIHFIWSFVPCLRSTLWSFTPNDLMIPDLTGPDNMFTKYFMVIHTE